MKLIIETYKGLPCKTKDFFINDIEADEDDFIEIEVCGDSMTCNCYTKVITKEAQQNILDKYKINKDEYDKVCEELKYKLTIINCGRCS